MSPLELHTRHRLPPHTAAVILDGHDGADGIRARPTDVNLKCLIHRYPQTPHGTRGPSLFAPGWCLGIVIALVEGHVSGRPLARDKEGLGRGLTQVTDPSAASTNSDPPAAAPSQSISLPALTEVGQQTPPELVELFGSIPVGQQGSQGPLANLRTIGHTRLYGIESADLTHGLRDLQRRLVDRGCSKFLHLLCVIVH
ncbi:unnamed protein product [Vitrella brassicaformis CCMP3155]|uniref:Uncharacterized protein n=1 Tax=Vitrella brassicaformis (strain CCMP3155) TaxID=1169540 RepID=A0A0G4EBS0_VITBC|nr:unnamed protein product [Vitrella brassicaformis CCMP3155]|eukprot:CEL92975.1 unnamed protein product [Vitrella brassicaformis CCMP3155]